MTGARTTKDDKCIRVQAILVFPSYQYQCPEREAEYVREREGENQQGRNGGGLGLGLRADLSPTEGRKTVLVRLGAGPFARTLPLRKEEETLLDDITRASHSPFTPTSKVRVGLKPGGFVRPPCPVDRERERDRET